MCYENTTVSEHAFIQTQSAPNYNVQNFCTLHESNMYANKLA